MSEHTTPCPVCKKPLAVKQGQGRRSGKPCLILVCPVDGRHFRGFITDQRFIASVLKHLAGPQTKEA